MKKVNAQEHAKALVKANGLENAIKIAERSIKSSNSSHESQLPNSSKGVNIFFPTNTKTSTKEAIKGRQKTNGFWTQVLGILHKGIKNVK